MMRPLVSIIIPTFNSSTYLKFTLNSLLSQTYSNWECILVDDGSTDLTRDIIAKYQEGDHRFGFFNRQENLPKGPSSARNFGVTQAKGNYLVFLDADDLLASTCLENRVQVFNENQTCDFLVFQMERFLNEPDYTKKTSEIETDKNIILASFIRLHGQWPITSPIYKTDFFKTIGFNQELSIFEDLEVAIKSIIFSSNFKVFKTIDCYYRNDENYKVKYNSIEVKSKMMKGYQTFLVSIAELINSNPEIPFKNEDIKFYIVESYKKLFRFIILDNSKAFREDNKTIIQILSSHKFLSKKEKLQFQFVDLILMPFVTIKGSGVARLIKFIYN